MISVIEPQPAGSSSTLIQQTADIFSPNGILSRSPNFEYRPQQQEMAVAVAKALADGEHLAVEAGTGVGKSLAYLVPAILYAVANKKKAVICTHTINLQEQLTQKDLPVLEQIMPLKFSYTMLKGRGNYVCTRRLHKAAQQAPNLFTTTETEELQRILSGRRRPKTAACRTSTSSPTPRSGTRSAPSGACARPSCAATRQILPKTTASVSFSARAIASCPRMWWY